RQHSFAGARRTDQYYIMPACSRNFEGAFNIFLPAYFAEVAFVGGEAFIKLFSRINNLCLKLHLANKKTGDLLYIFDTIHLKVINNGCFAGVLFGQDEAFKTILTGLYGNGQCAFYGLQAAIERKLAHDDVLVKVFVFNLPGAREYADGYGKIIRRTFLADVGRRHIDYYLLPWHAKIIGLQGSFHPLHRFAHGIVRQAHNQVKWFASAAYIYLNCYGDSF